jgi:GNAT superfamily N-acetyltransferase
MFKLRPAALADAQALANLSIQLGYSASSSEIEKRLTAVLGDFRHLVFVAEIAGRIVGWAHAYLCCLVESDSFAELGGLVVDEAHRSHGVGGKLVENVEAWARQNGCSYVSVRSNVLRERAHGFYAGRGYDKIKTQHVFRKIL